MERIRYHLKVSSEEDVSRDPQLRSYPQLPTTSTRSPQSGHHSTQAYEPPAPSTQAPFAAAPREPDQKVIHLRRHTLHSPVHTSSSATSTSSSPRQASTLGPSYSPKQQERLSILSALGQHCSHDLLSSTCSKGSPRYEQIGYRDSPSRSSSRYTPIYSRALLFIQTKEMISNWPFHNFINLSGPITPAAGYGRHTDFVSW